MPTERSRSPAVPEGGYTLGVKPNACFSPTSVPLTVGAQNESREIPVGLVVDKGGYSCAVSDGAYLRGTDPVTFTSGVWATVELPFPIALYNGSHDTLGIGLRGVISPDTTTGPGSGGAGIFPFCVQTPVEFAPGGGVFTAATKVNGEDAFVVEYRNAKLWAYPDRSEYTEPVSFSATLTRSGTVIFGYGDGIGTDDPVTAGAHGHHRHTGLGRRRRHPVLRQRPGAARRDDRHLRHARLRVPRRDRRRQERRAAGGRCQGLVHRQGRARRDASRPTGPASCTASSRSATTP